jgi:transcriptional regulator GlxA family with amidase domain
VALISKYYQQIIEQYSGTLQAVSVVTDVLAQCNAKYNYAPSIENIAAHHGITTRTLQRYFEKATGTGTKQALQLLRIRKAVEQLVNAPSSFDYRQYGYYDYSHFYKHLTAFLNHQHIELLKPHLELKRTIAE